MCWLKISTDDSPPNGTDARRQLVQDDAERVDVGARVDRLALAPARATCRAACRRWRRCASGSTARRRRSSWRCRSRGSWPPRAPPLRARKTFSGFMSRCTMPLSCAAARPCPTAMSIRHAPRSSAQRRPVAHALGERLPVEKLHRQVDLPRRQRGEVVDLDDVLVADRRRRPRLLAKALHRLRPSRRPRARAA